MAITMFCEREYFFYCLPVKYGPYIRYPAGPDMRQDNATFFTAENELKKGKSEEKNTSKD